MDAHHTNSHNVNHQNASGNYGGHHSHNDITYFAETDFRNRRTKFGIKSTDRTRHVYVIGKTGMGKSTLLENMAIQDIQNGNGLAFIDPHGKTAELLMEYIPKERLNDVLYFAPFDMDNPISFNVMEDVGPDKRHLVVNGLMSTFEKIWVDAWSARMAYILQNTLLALLETPGSTLLGINRMLSDKDYRKMVIGNVQDPSVRSFWVDEFSKYTDRYTQEATPAIQNKVGQFTSNPLIRNIIGQPKSSFDFRKIMDEKKIVIINLSKGKVGEGNANLLGSMLITKIYLAAMSRADVADSKLRTLPNFYLYVDEFQSFANKSFADILSEARKYKLNLTIAHQYIEQMEEEVAAAVFGNVGTMVTFRVGAYDAEVLEKEFAPQFTAEDLVNLGIYQVYLKLMIDGVSSAPFSAVTLAPLEKHDALSFDNVIEASRKNYSNRRDIVESEIKNWHQPIVPVPEKKKEEPKIQERSILVEKIKEKEVKVENKVTPPLVNNSLPTKNAVEEKPFAKAFSELGLKSEKEALPKVSQMSPVSLSNEKSAPVTFKQNDANVSLDKVIKEKNDKGLKEKNMTDLKSALFAVLNNSKNDNKKNDERGKFNDVLGQTNPIKNSVPSSEEKNKVLGNGTEDVSKNNDATKEREEVSPEVLKEVLSFKDLDVSNGNKKN